MFKDPFSFDGRIRRTEYGISILICLVCSVFLGLATDQRNGGSATFAAGYIPLLWFGLAQGAKRCHDLGNSGWWQFVPFYGFCMVFQDGLQPENDYGLNPKTFDTDPMAYGHRPGGRKAGSDTRN